MRDLWENAFVKPMEDFFQQLGAFLPHLLAMLSIIILGIAAAWIAKVIVLRLLDVFNFDQFSTRVGLSQALGKGGLREVPSKVIGRIVFWTIILTFLILGLGTLQFSPVDRVVDQAFTYIPRFLIALTIIGVGIIFGNFVGRATLIGAVNAQFPQARFLARGVRLAVFLFALAMAFEQLGIATSVIVATFSIAFGGVVLALAIAFGLGAKDTVKNWIEKTLDESKEEGGDEKDDDLSHL
ncbi:MAG TPA: hypothetical protein VLB09_03660 [Nitrospiria bacterium]|nr:hypothetical protein [Nitrospiria bacterium]